MKFVIAGGGIGGFSAALCLLQAGYEVVLLEQSKEFMDVGAGIQLGANAICVLESLGLYEVILEKAVQPERIDVRLFDSGDRLYRSELGEQYAQDYGAPYLNIHRSDLLAVLSNAVKQHSRFECKMGARVINFSQRNHQVYVELEGLNSIVADALVAADGVRSIVGPKISDQHGSRWTGNVAWRGTVATSQLPENFMDKVVTNFVGPNKHMVIYYLRQQQLVNFVGVVGNQSWQEESWTTKASWQQLRNDFLGWHPSVQAVINAVEKQNCYRWALHDHLPLSKWSEGRVTLLGDAAHATLPFMASGAAMAIEDARILARAVEEYDDIEHAFQSYQRNRMGRTARVQRYSSHAAKLYNLPYKPLIKLAFKALSMRAMRGNNPDRWLPEYNANKVKLT